MNTLTRITQLERRTPQAKDKQFRQEVRAKGNTYFIDGVQVDALTYHTEHADYLRLRGIEYTVNMDVIWCGGGVSTGDGTFEAGLYLADLMRAAEEAAHVEGLLSVNETFDNCQNDAVRAEIRRRVLAELEKQRDEIKDGVQ